MPYWQTALGTDYGNAIDTYRAVDPWIQRGKKHILNFVRQNVRKRNRLNQQQQRIQMPRRRNARTNRRRAYRPKSGRRRRARRKRSNKGTERRMRGGGNKLRLKTHIIPKETIVTLPFRKNINLTKIATVSDGNFWHMSYQNTLYWSESIMTGLGTATRTQQMVRGADAWASFYRQYEILAMKITIDYRRDDSGGISEIQIFPIIHVGRANRCADTGTATAHDFMSQKNTRVYGPVYTVGTNGANNNGLKCKAYMKKYLSNAYLRREERNPADSNALTGLLATAGANNTDPAFSWFINVGFATPDGLNFQDATGGFGRATIKVDYTVRFYDRKYFIQDVDGDGDQGPATQQLGAIHSN